jgi:hypothetical protein
METADACFELCLGQAPAGVLMLRQLEAATGWIVAQSEANLWIQLLRQANGFKSFVFNPRFGGRLI